MNRFVKNNPAWALFIAVFLMAHGGHVVYALSRHGPAHVLIAFIFIIASAHIFYVAADLIRTAPVAIAMAEKSYNKIPAKLVLVYTDDGTATAIIKKGKTNIDVANILEHVSWVFRDMDRAGVKVVAE